MGLRDVLQEGPMPARSSQKQSFVRSSIAFLLVGLIALLSIVGTTIWLVERAQVYFNEVLRARDVRSAAVELQTALLAAESAQRGFVFTGNEIYLAPYDSAKANAARRLDGLKDLQDDQNIRVAVKRLTTLVDEKFSEMEKTIELKRARDDAGVAAAFRTNRGKALMDEANVFLGGIIRSADERLTRGVLEERRNAALLRFVTIVAGVVIVIVVGGAAIAVLRYTRELARARDEVEIRVVERTAELARANEEVRRFAHIVSHDLRAPLVNIMGFTSELEISADTMRVAMENMPADPMNDQARIAATQDLPEALGFIRSSTAKMNDLIDAVLKLSREGQRRLNPEQISLEDIVARSASAIQHQLAEAGGKVSIDMNVPAIRTDRLSIEQIIGNLFDNAVKYRSRDRPLEIGVRARNTSRNRVNIEVSDNGRGIAEKDHDRVFDLFKRSGPQDQPGEGVGLAYVRTMVRNLGGEISLTSTPGNGTTFRITLPRDLAEKAG